MLSNKEFAVFNKVPATLSGEMEEFAMFTLDLGDVKVAKGGVGCKRVVTNANPHLRSNLVISSWGKSINLWEVTPIRVEMTKAEMIAATNDERIASEVVAKAERENRVAMYASKVANELPLFEEDADEWDTLTEDEKFFALDTEMVGGKCRRKGGIKNHDGFESLVDG